MSCIIRRISCLVLNVWLWLVTIITLYAMLVWYDIMKCPAGSNYEWWKKFYEAASNFLIGFIISFFFYFLVIYLPDKRRRHIIKSNVNKMYTCVKRDILCQIIFASQKGGIQGINADDDTIDRLMTIDGFKAVFSGGKEAHEGWYAFANGLEKDGIEFKGILFNLQLLSKQIGFILQNYIVLDEQVFGFLKNLEAIIFQMEKLQPAYDDTKILCGFLWQMFTGWDWIEGYLGYDPIERMLKEI